MAEEKKAVQQAEKAVKKATAKAENKVVAFLKNLPGKIAKPFKNMWYELKKVSWPSKQKLLVCSAAVLVFIVVMGIVVGLLDMGASALVRLLVNA